ncbi:MAG: PEP-CTERM sorting domain-containing protein, partial [Chthoniobacteraceae bacterium]
EMKNKMKLSTGGLMLAAVAACVGLAPTARAQFTMSYEFDSGDGVHHAGDAFSGPMRINLANFDMGTLYAPMDLGSAQGYGANGTGPQSIDGGIATLAAAAASPATGAYNQPTVINGVAQPASASKEDSWGIAQINTITDLAGNVVWSEGAKNAQLTIMFYGEKDFYVNQLANGFQEINGVGLHVDLYYKNKASVGYTAYNPTPGSLGRSGPSDYATVTDGNLILSTVSTGGFLHNDGTLGGLATEFSSNFNATSGGSGQAYLSVTGGSMAAAFDQNYYTSPFVAGRTADLFAQFTTTLNDVGNDWLVRSNDPVGGAFVPVPEPSTYGLAGAALLSGMIALRRRSQKRAKA